MRLISEEHKISLRLSGFLKPKMYLASHNILMDEFLSRSGQCLSRIDLTSGFVGLKSNTIIRLLEGSVVISIKTSDCVIPQTLSNDDLSKSCGYPLIESRLHSSKLYLIKSVQ